MSKLWKKKHLAHQWFDKLWKNHTEREKYYQLLADKMEMPKEKCHFSQMTMAQLDKAIEFIKEMWWEKYDR